MATEAGAGPHRILVAVDHQPHTAAALDWALAVAAALGAQLTAVHVVDPYLKQFYNEIYAQGRAQYLDHVDACLAEEGAKVIAAVEAQSAARGVALTTCLRHGAPLAEIVGEVAAGGHDTVVVGGRRRRRPDLGSRLTTALGHTTVVVVRG